MDYQQALLDPTSVFSQPADVLNDKALDREQKIRILKRWEYDARELQVAEEENMAGDAPSMLGEVHEALAALGAQMHPDDSPPTKQGGA